MQPAVFEDRVNRRFYDKETETCWLSVMDQNAAIVQQAAAHADERPNYGGVKDAL